jgi:hypothetical protein
MGISELIEKAREHTTKIFNYKKEAETYISRNHNFISDYTIMNIAPDQKENETAEEVSIRQAKEKRQRFIVKVIKPIDDHFNQCHNGSQVLAMSKRIMNEVHSVAHENKINIYYQDTDSLQLNAGVNNSQVKLLGDKFKEKYGRELIGKNMGQFHCDFSFTEQLPDYKFDYSNYKVVKSTKCDSLIDVKSQEAFFLGKKLYMHVLCGKSNIDGKIKNKEHARVKGIPSYCLEGKAKKHFTLLKTGRAKHYNISKTARARNKALFKMNIEFNDKDFQNNIKRFIHEVLPSRIEKASTSPR